MPSTGNIFPTTGENNAGIGATAWTNPGNVTADDAADATCNAGASSQYLVARNFDFGIPADATIVGITVRVEASEHTAGTEGLNAQLQNDSGTLVGSSKSQTISGTGKSVYTYGAANDVWSATLTPAIVNDVDFGVRLWFTTAHDIRIDFVTMAVEYVLPTAPRSFFANGQSPALVAGLVGFAGMAAIFSAGEFAPPPPSADIPQETRYSLSTRNLNQPAPVFQKIASMESAAVKPPSRPISAAPQQREAEPQPLIFGQTPASTEFIPVPAWKVDIPRPLDQPAPWFSKQVPPSVVVQPTLFHWAGTLPQSLDQPSAKFSKGIFPQVLEPPPLRFFGTIPQPFDIQQAIFAHQPPASVEPEEQPIPQPTGFYLSTRELNQPAPVFSKVYIFPPPPPPEETKPKFFFGVPQQNPFQPQPLFLRKDADSVTSVLPAAEWTAIGNQLHQPTQPVFKRQVLSSAVAAAILRPHRFAAEPASTFQPQPVFAHVPPPSAAAVVYEPGKASLSVQPRHLDQPAPVFFRKPPPSEAPPAEILKPSPPSLAVQPRRLDQPAPVFARHPFPEAKNPGQPFLPNWHQTQLREPPQPKFSRAVEFTPPPSVTYLPGKASISWQGRRLDQPAPVFFNVPFVEATLPPKGFTGINYLQPEVIQPIFKRQIPASVAPPVPPNRPHDFASGQPNLQQPAPQFSRFPPPSVAPTPTPNRPHFFATGQPDTQQPQPLFSHQPPPSQVGPPPPPPFPDVIPWPPHGKPPKPKPPKPSAREELRQIVENYQQLELPLVIEPQQLDLLSVEILSPLETDDDLIPPLLLLGML